MVFGACSGTSDVAMNAHAVVVETAYSRPLMSSFHGAWSLGSLATATVSSVLAAFGWTPLARALGPAVVTLVGMALAAQAMLPPQSRERASGQRFVWPSRHLLGLGLVAFCAFMAEGAIRNWSVVFLQRDLGAAPAVAAAGYAVFSLTMTVGRLTGDWVTARSAPDRVVRLGGLLLTGALGAALFIDRTPAVIVGLALCGLALANILPLAFSAAGRATDRGAGSAIAAVTTTGYVGYLVGPPAIGVTADHFTVRGGLVLVVMLGLIVLALAPAVRPAPRAHTDADER
jgi:fucose permease